MNLFNNFKLIRTFVKHNCSELYSVQITVVGRVMLGQLPKDWSIMVRFPVTKFKRKRQKLTMRSWVHSQS